MLSSSLLELSSKRGVFVAVGVVIAAAVALIFGDAHSLGMTFN